MPKIYDRDCDHCGKHYRKRDAAHFCSPECYNDARTIKMVARKEGAAESDAVKELTAQIQRLQGQLKQKETIKQTFAKGVAEIDINSFSINTLEAALEAAQVDMEKWVVARHVINSWQVTMKLKDAEGVEQPETRTNWQVKIWLKPKVVEPIEAGFLRLIDRMPPAKRISAPKFTRPSGVAAEMALLDAHFGMLAWALETGRRDYDINIAAADYLAACDTNLGYIEPFKPEKIIFILGQDLMHVENYAGTTPQGGNILDVDSRLPKIFEKAMETVIETVYHCRSVAPVEVLWIPGNHDMHASMFLAHAIRQHFLRDKHVEVDVSPETRKARVWGKLLVGWAHELLGKPETWANELALAWPKLWGESEFREWHHGHKHRKKETRTHPVMAQGGVLLRQLQALTVIDAWHYQHGFTDAIPGGEAFVWTKDRGIIANFTAWSGESPGT